MQRHDSSSSEGKPKGKSRRSVGKGKCVRRESQDTCSDDDLADWQKAIGRDEDAAAAAIDPNYVPDPNDEEDTADDGSQDAPDPDDGDDDDEDVQIMGVALAPVSTVALTRSRRNVPRPNYTQSLPAPVKSRPAPLSRKKNPPKAKDDEDNAASSGDDFVDAPKEVAKAKPETKTKKKTYPRKADLYEAKYMVSTNKTQFVLLITFAYVKFNAMASNRWKRKELLMMLSSFLQHKCNNCEQAFHSAERLRTHKYTCAFCPKCKNWVEYRHIENCKGQRIRAPRIVCPLCQRLKSIAQFPRHMNRMHQIANYSMAGKKFESEASKF